MDCPHCSPAARIERSDRTALGYRRFRCRHCDRGFNERTGTLYNGLQYLRDILLLVVLWRLRYKLSLRELAEMFLERGFVYMHEMVREWEAKLAPLIAENLRKRRRGVVGASWYVDETYIKVDGRWCYLYRAIDRNSHLAHVRLSETRDLAAAKAFFRSARAVTDVTPDRVTSDGHGSYPRAIACELREGVAHRTNQYLNYHLAQDHRGIKQRVPPMLDFKRFSSAAEFCLAHDALRNSLRPTTARNQKVSVARRRLMNTRRHCALTKLLKAA